MILGIFRVLAAFGLAGCSSTDRLELMAGSGQEAITREGSSALVSAKTQLVMQANLASLQGNIIKNHTLMPGEWYGGTIVLDVPKKSKAGITNYLVSVMVDGETHQFQISQKKMK